MATQKFTLFSGWKTQILRQGVALSLCATLLPFTQLNLMAQDGLQDPAADQAQQPAPGPGPAAYVPQSPDQLEQLVAPIALYPDSLVAQTLAAATYPQQVQQAEDWMQQNGNQPPAELAAQVNTMPWDPSVKALTAFPSVLDMLARGQQWTIALGNAYYNQPADVMTAVQAMRFRARDAGQLRSSPQLAVVDDGPAIVIQPVNPGVVYVPYYDPWAVYGAPIPVFYGFFRPPPPPGFFLGVGIGIGFGIGIGIGAWGGFGWGYHAWAPNWRSNTIIVNNRTFISNSTTVYNRGHFGAYNQGFDHAGPQGFAHASFNRSAPMYNGHPMSATNRPAAAANRPGAFNRPAAAANRPGAYNRPGAPANHPGAAARPAAPAYRGAPASRPAAPAARSNAYSRPTGTAGGYSRPTGTYNRPAAGGARPQAVGPHGGASHAAAAPHAAPAAHSAPAPHGGGGASHGGGGEHHH